ncbi:MAG: nucleotidyltransferase domain-containing protein [Actinomycetota bacterium]|nr:nucleotidyltransferase domain-containing protein [Actinomycetota bacterium]
MLNMLFSSKTRVEVLKLFLFNAGDCFYQRQISRLTAQSIRGVQREIEKLIKIGIIETYTQGNRNYYKLNQACPIFQDLKNIFLKTLGVAKILKESFQQEGIKYAFIYGSYARGEENLLSDIDLMVIGDISSKKLSSILSEPKEKLMREINYAAFSLNEFIERVIQKDHFINSILNDKKIYIIGSEDELREAIKSGQVKAS